MSMTDSDDDLDGDFEDEELDPVSVEERARAQGWRPMPADPQNPTRDEYRGDPRNWTTAEEFLEKGEREWPIMRDNNRRMSERLVRQGEELEGLKRTVGDQAEAIRAATALAQRADERGYKRARDDILARQKEAVSAGDEVAFDQITAELNALDSAREDQREEPPPPRAEPPPAPTGQTELSPEHRAFIAANPWFNDRTRPYLRAAAIGFENTEALRDPDASFTERLAVVLEKMKRDYPEIEGDEMPQRRDPFRRRAAPSMEPSTVPLRRPRQGASPIDAIGDQEERRQARAAFNSIKRGMPEYTEAEYMAVYDDPHADVLDVMKQHRKK
jgi:hypothetical protein